MQRVFFAVFSMYAVKVNGFLKDIWCCGARILCIALVHRKPVNILVVSLGVIINSFNHDVLFLHTV